MLERENLRVDDFGIRLAIFLIGSELRLRRASESRRGIALTQITACVQDLRAHGLGLGHELLHVRGVLAILVVRRALRIVQALTERGIDDIRFVERARRLAGFVEQALRRRIFRRRAHRTIVNVLGTSERILVKFEQLGIGRPFGNVSFGSFGRRLSLHRPAPPRA